MIIRILYGNDDNNDDNNHDYYCYCSDQQSSCVDSSYKGRSKKTSNISSALVDSLPAAFGKTFNSPHPSSTSTSILNPNAISTLGFSAHTTASRSSGQGSGQGSSIGSKMNGTRLKKIASTGTGPQIPMASSQSGECNHVEHRTAYLILNCISISIYLFLLSISISTPISISVSYYIT